MQNEMQTMGERRLSWHSTMRELRLSVVVPVFNEAAHIRANLELLLAEVVPHFSAFEILVVSDGSTDGTDEVLRTINQPRVRCITYEKNMGKGYAVREGFKAATGDYILFIDGGMELAPREIRIFMGLMELYDADVVIGSKRHPQSRVDYPTSRRVLSFIYQRLVKILFDLNVTDTQVGLKLFKREVIAAILPDLTINRYGFDLEVLALARRKGYRRFLEAPIRLDYFHSNKRPFARETLHVVKIALSILFDTLRLYKRIRSLPAATPSPKQNAKQDEAAA